MTLVAFLANPPAGAADAAAAAAARPTFPPGPVVETGPARSRERRLRPGQPCRTIPEGTIAQPNRFTMESYGLEFTAISPPWTTLTAYDLNKGIIKWQIGLGDDYRAAVKGAHGTGAAEFMKSSVVVTSTGLLFVTAADRKLHIYDADNGKELRHITLGATSSGSPSMFELNGTPVSCWFRLRPWARARAEKAAPPTRTRQGPTGLIAFAVKK